MSSPEERIRELARAQSIAPAEAERLLAAVRPAEAEARPRRLNPFDRWSGEITSLLGLVVALAAIGTSRLGARYDGALDLHFGHFEVPLTTALLDQGIAVLVSAAVLWGAARVVSRARFVDVLGAVSLSRAPVVLAAVPLASLTAGLPPDLTKPSALILVIAVLALIAVGAHITLLVFGFRTATGARGGRLAASVVAGLFAAEVVSKIALFLVTR